MSEKQKKTKSQPYLPIDGSEDPHQLLIPLQNFKLHHDTDVEENESQSDSIFVGRDSLMTQLTELLNNTFEKRGSYLVAGYRGAGKTSLMNRVIYKYKDKAENKTIKKEIIHARINLGHDSVLNTRHVLFNIISVLKHELDLYSKKELEGWIKAIELIFISALYVVFGYLFSEWISLVASKFYSFITFSEIIDIATNKSIGFVLFMTFLHFLFLYLALLLHNSRWGLIYLCIFFLLFGGYLSNWNPFSDSDFYSSVTLLKIKDIQFENWPISSLFFLLFLVSLLTSNTLRGFFMNLILFRQINIGKNKYLVIKEIHKLHDKVAYSFEKDISVSSLHLAKLGLSHKTNIPEMKEPQIELELLNFLNLCRQVGFDIIFVFDELDKISLTVTDSSVNTNNANGQATKSFENETLDEHIYRRKKNIDSLLASLKTLITVGQARFFFIAGRDMLDSYQSEKGSTSSLYESLFNQVFEVPSFLTDDSDEKITRLHSMIGVYVCKRLLDQKTAEQHWYANKICEEVIKRIKKAEEKHSSSELVTLLNEENNEATFEFLLKKMPDVLLKQTKKREYRNKIDNIWNTYLQILKESLFVTKDNEEDVTKDSKVSAKQYSVFARFLTAHFNEKFTCDELKRIVSEINSDNESLFKPHLYSFNNLNIYYLYLLHNIDSKRDATLVIQTLSQFIHYLTIHSWGNCKRLASLFESFTKPISMANTIHNAMNWLPKSNDTHYMLHFGVTERQRISMGSNLYIMFNHHLSRQFTNADKLVVSTMASLHYCLKFHRSAFSRHHLFRMTEMMSIYSSPELNSIFETAFSQVLWPYLRTIRNGMHQYRFFTWFEQEIRYIARVNDLESASYTFSLDAINNIKAHYRNTLEKAMRTYKVVSTFSQERGPGLIAEINIVLGDIYLLERSYDESVIFYQTAVNAHHNLDKKETYHLECLLRFVEALLKLGNVQEHRQRYDRAAMNYYQAKQLVDEFLIQQGQSSNIKRLDDKNDSEMGVQRFLTDCDPKWVLLKQPHWALLYLDIKKSHGERVNISLPDKIYGKNDPYGHYRTGQLYFYLGRYSKAKQAFIKAIKIAYKKERPDENEDRVEQYYNYHLLPTACINLAENVLVEEMQNLSNLFQNSNTWKRHKMASCLSKSCFELIKSMDTVNSFADLETIKIDIPSLEKEGKIDMKGILTLIFYAARQYEKNNLYDHAAMAYLKALTLWISIIDMIALNDLKEDDEKGKIIENMYLWLDKANEKALSNIMNATGQAQQQAKEKWRFRDLADYPQDEPPFDIETVGRNNINDLHTIEGRDKLNEDITFWQGSYLGQQLIVMNTWAFTTKRKLLDETPHPIKSYRLPLYTTRALILSSWTNGREHLEQAEQMYLALRYKFSHKASHARESAKMINKDLNNKLNKSKTKTEAETHVLNPEECYYIISAKGIHNFNFALNYTRILTDNNQNILVPTSAVVMLNLWLLLYKLVKYEKYIAKVDYEQSCLTVRAKLIKFVSRESATTSLDLSYVAKETIRQMKIIVNMGNLSSSSRRNIVQNKYYLDDDYEDPGFHIDWTVIQMLSPTALMSIKWIEEQMEIIQTSKST